MLGSLALGVAGETLNQVVRGVSFGARGGSAANARYQRIWEITNYIQYSFESTVHQADKGTTSASSRLYPDVKASDNTLVPVWVPFCSISVYIESLPRSIGLLPRL